MARPKKSAVVQTPVKKISPVSGVLDVITDTDPLWDILIKRFDRFSRNFGFSKTDLSVLDDILVFEAYDPKVREHAIILEAANRTLALRPHLLPSVLRAYNAAKVNEAKPLSKWSFLGQVQQYTGKKQLETEMQFGFEVFGNFTHLTEAQVMGVAWEMVASLGIRNIVLEINNTGFLESQRQYQSVLADFLKTKKYDLCDNCVELVTNGESMLVFRCTELGCQTIVSEAPVILDFLDDDAKKHFTNILEALEELQIPYQLNPHYVGVRGSVDTNFVIKYKSKVKTVVIGEGSYHTDIARAVTGKSPVCFGFVGSLSSLYNVLKQEQVEVQRDVKNEVYLVPLGELAAKKSLRLFRDLISAKISVYDHFGNVGVKSQLKAAQDSKSPIALIMGQKEAVDEMVILRDVKSGMQEMFHYEKIIDEVKKRLGK